MLRLCKKIKQWLDISSIGNYYELPISNKKCLWIRPKKTKIIKKLVTIQFHFLLKIPINMSYTTTAFCTNEQMTFIKKILLSTIFKLKAIANCNRTKKISSNPNQIPSYHNILNPFQQPFQLGKMKCTSNNFQFQNLNWCWCSFSFLIWK